MLKKKLLKRYWLKMRVSFNAVKMIFDAFDTKRQEQLLKDKQLYCANRIKRKCRIATQRFAPTLDERMINLFRHSYTSVSNFLYEPALKVNAQTVTDYIQCKSDQHMIFTKFIAFSEKMHKLVSVSLKPHPNP